MQTPPPLSPGDVIGVVSISRKVDADALAPFLARLASEGFRVRLGKTLAAEQAVFAGCDELRAADLQTMLDDPEVRAVWFARGGYGAIRVIDKINWRALRKAPKWLVGFSDLTLALAAALRQGVCAIHAMVGTTYGGKWDEANFTSTCALLRGERPEPVILTGENRRFRPGKARGRLVGGNLSLLQCLLGTPYDVETDGCILFLEDVDEYLYQIDRMLACLALAGKLRNLAGLVAGGFTEVKDNDDPPFGESETEIVARRAADGAYPFATGFPAGHDRTNLPLVLGAKYELTVEPERAVLAML